MRRSEPENQYDYHTKIFYELSALVLNMMRCPPPPMEYSEALIQRSGRSSVEQMTPAGLASLLLGISLALMLCGSVTFFIGFILMPWVIGLVMFLYFVGMVSGISMIGKAIFSYNNNNPNTNSAPPPPSPRKDVPSWKFL
ncbi:hypothetical protein ACJIZ3_010450 [Penstemon smallii]|uniref:Transmembrane protein n=1 Tax=Penstemon smallii TaxID=265156 RepID=A0ABD3TFD1_9LAMI